MTSSQGHQHKHNWTHHLFPLNFIFQRHPLNGRCSQLGPTIQELSSMSLPSSLVSHQTVLTSSPERALRNTCSSPPAPLLPQAGPPPSLRPQNLPHLITEYWCDYLITEKSNADPIWFAYTVSSVWLPFPYQSLRCVRAQCSYPELSIRWASHESPTILSSLCWL